MGIVDTVEPIVASTKDNEEKHVEESSVGKVEPVVVSSPPQENQETPDAPIAIQQESPKEPQAEAAIVENVPAEESVTQDPSPEQQGVDTIEEKAVAETPAGESATIPVSTDEVTGGADEVAKQKFSILCC